MRFANNQKVYALLSVLLLMAAVPLFLVTSRVSSADLANRSVAVSTSVPNATANHTFRFDVQTAGLMGSIEFEYCSNDPFVGMPCTVPAGLVVNGANLVAQTGETGFVVDPSSTANKLVLSRVPVPAVPQPVSYSLNDIVNPSTPSQTVYVRVSTYVSNDATGPRTDSGAVVFSTSGGLGTMGYVPPFLIFCVGITVGPSCSSASGSSINLGELSPAAPRAATSQFSGATNDLGGYSTTVLGTTMTSGSNTIPALPAPSPSVPGTSQFGINLRANSSPSVGQDPTGPGISTVQPGYAAPNQFAFVSGSTLTASSGTTDFNIFTVSYLVNVSSAQKPGVYNTTATFIATAAF